LTKKTPPFAEWRCIFPKKKFSNIVNQVNVTSVIPPDTTVPITNRTIYDWGYDATIDSLGK